MAAPHLGGAPNPEGTLRQDRGCETSLEPNQRPQEGATFGAPTPPSALREKDAFFVPLSALGGAPKHGPPLQRRGGGDPDPLTLSPPAPRPLPRGPSPGLLLGRA